MLLRLRKIELKLVRKPPKVPRGYGGVALAAPWTGSPSWRGALERNHYFGGSLHLPRSGPGSGRPDSHRCPFPRPPKWSKMTLSDTKNDPLGDQNSECSFSHGASAGDLRPYWQIVTFRYGPKLRFWGSSSQNHFHFEGRDFRACGNAKDFGLWTS